MGKITASRKTLKPDPQLRVAPGQQVHQLPDARRQEERRAGRVLRRAGHHQGEDARRGADRGLHAGGREREAVDRGPQSNRVGGAAYQVPMQVNRNRQQSLAIRWILLARPREEGPRRCYEKLAEELMAAYNREGAAMHQARKRPPHGRRQQGLRPLRVVVLRACKHTAVPCRERTVSALCAGSCHRIARPIRPDTRTACPCPPHRQTSATSASSPTSTPARRRSPSGCCIYTGAKHRDGRGR